MNIKSNNLPFHISGDQMLERSLWFGPNLVTFLITSAETNGAFALIRCVLIKGFEPPLHIHSNEDESSFILDGEIGYQAGDREIHARAGDFVHLPKLVPHTFKPTTDTVTLLLLITPGGFEAMFRQCSRPAIEFALPPVTGEKPNASFFELMTRANKDLGVLLLPDL
ncbi:cupin domain-containing protein [Mucilaginibacter sp. BJC16-A38]|uniref:cupin domain-containing protein n=1 Tax=Mucilaginibacter phenanthrenivorans TaxID=1234842 RepID=UPI0021587CE8|nr:cupin domain-containing protein [Mucilaginibacter phenanthrenivorans]MCR8557844.1 cupin domain-containing protein [Mucilaginibacter phenanthrenivorans]